jgi:hypothetical protein
MITQNNPNHISFVTTPAPGGSCFSQLTNSSSLTTAHDKSNDNGRINRQSSSKKKMVAITANVDSEIGPLIVVSACDVDGRERSSSPTPTATIVSLKTTISQQEQPRRSVSFASTKCVYKIPSRRQLSKEERENYYLSVHEQQKIKDQVRQLSIAAAHTKSNDGKTKTLADDDVDDDDEDSSRGLEQCTPTSFMQSKARKLKARNIVLDYQALEVGADLIAVLYKQCTEESRCLARTRGILDQHIMLNVSGRLHDKSSPPLNIVMIR